MNEQLEDVVKRFGFDPTSIGLRHRAWNVITTPDDYDTEVGAKEGWLCVRARDGASNPIDGEALKLPNFFYTEEDTFDRTYRYYWFKPLDKEAEPVQARDLTEIEKLRVQLAAAHYVLALIVEYCHKFSESGYLVPSTAVELAKKIVEESANEKTK